MCVCSAAEALFHEKRTILHRRVHQLYVCNDRSKCAAPLSNDISVFAWDGSPWKLHSRSILPILFFFQWDFFGWSATAASAALPLCPAGSLHFCPPLCVLLLRAPLERHQPKKVEPVEGALLSSLLNRRSTSTIISDSSSSSLSSLECVHRLQSSLLCRQCVQESTVLWVVVVQERLMKSWLLLCCKNCQPALSVLFLAGVGCLIQTHKHTHTHTGTGVHILPDAFDHGSLFSSQTANLRFSWCHWWHSSVAFFAGCSVCMFAYVQNHILVKRCISYIFQLFL